MASNYLFSHVSLRINTQQRVCWDDEIDVEAYNNRRIMNKIKQYGEVVVNLKCAERWDMFVESRTMSHNDHSLCILPFTPTVICPIFSLSALSDSSSPVITPNLHRPIYSAPCLF